MIITTISLTRGQAEDIYRSGWLRGLTCGTSGLKISEVHDQVVKDIKNYFSPWDYEEIQHQREKPSPRKTGELKPLLELTKRWYQFWK